MEMDSSSEDDDYILEQNPLLIDTIIQRLMDFLSLKDAKNCRMVCHKWNYFAEPMLKKRGKIAFTNSFRPSEFMARFSQPNHMIEPFTAFSLIAGESYWQTYNYEQNNDNADKKDKRWTIFEIYEFFIQWGQCIKKLELSLTEVWMNRNDRHEIQKLNIDPLFESLSSNLEDLALEGFYGGDILFSINKLSSIKNIYLDTCCINLDSFENRIIPSKIKLVDVKFCRNGDILRNTIINDVVDFSTCSDIVLRIGRPDRRGIREVIKFDFSRDFVNSNRIDFRKIVPQNVNKVMTKTDSLILSYCPSEPVQIHLKELQLKDCKIDLTQISGTIEKLTIKECEVVSLDIQPLDLPNLKALSLNHHCSGTTSDSDIFKIASLFINCRNLFDLELARFAYSDVKVEWELDVSCLPKSVKVLKLSHNRGLKLVGSNVPIEVDILTLPDERRGEEVSENNSSMKKVLERIKTKVLIRAVFCHESCFREEPKETVSQFLADIVQDGKLQKTVVELKHGPHILKVLESVPQSKSCKNSADKSSLVLHEFLGKFLVTDEQEESEEFD